MNASLAAANEPVHQPGASHPGIPYVRSATSADDAFVDALHDLAFGPGRFARTAFRVRERFAIDPALSLIAEVDGQRCGSVWMTPISVGGTNGYLLGPLATHPDFRKRGGRARRRVWRLCAARGASCCWWAIATITARSAGAPRRAAPSPFPAPSIRRGCWSMPTMRSWRWALPARSRASVKPPHRPDPGRNAILSRRGLPFVRKNA